MKKKTEREEMLEALADAYDEARTGGIGDDGGSEPMWRASGAVTIAEYLESAGYKIVRDHGQSTPPDERG